MSEWHRKLSQYSWPDRFLLVEAVFMLGLARLAVLTLPFRWVMRISGDHLGQSSDDVLLADAETAERVAWAIQGMRYHTPWDSNCLARAIAGQQMLRRRGVESTLYIGVDNNMPRSFETHAWLRCGGRILTGAERKDQFTAFVSYAKKRANSL